MNRHEPNPEELATELRALRPTLSQEFASKLDARVAAGFPRQRRGAAFLADLPGAAVGRLTARLHRAGLRRALLPALAGATTVVIVATAVIVSTEGGDNGTTGAGGDRDAAQTVASAGAQAKGLEKGLEGMPPELRDLPKSAQVESSSELIAPLPPAPGGGTAPRTRNRQVERSAELTLGTSPGRVQDVAGEVIDVVGRHRGIVLSSSVRDGREGEAGATFDLLIPNRRLDGALSELSGLADVRSRSENTLDITAPFISARERLRDARAEAAGLLRQLAEADTDAERASVKAQLRVVRGRIAAFRSQVRRLERRADFSRVSLQVVTGEGAALPGAGDEWTLGDALHDAGRVLAVAAGVILVGLAVILPLALIGGTAWATRRFYLHRAREQTLGA